MEVSLNIMSQIKNKKCKVYWKSDLPEASEKGIQFLFRSYAF